MDAVGRLEELDSKLERYFADWLNLLIGQISLRVFHGVETAGFYYENPANDVNGDENFVQESVSDDDDVLSDNGENDDGNCLTSDEGSDDGRSHNDDDHDIHGSFYHLHDDEETVGDRSRNDDNHGGHGNICHLCIYVRSDESHGHNDDDHDSGTGDDDEENDHDDDFAGVNIDHGHCRQRAKDLLLCQNCVG